MKETCRTESRIMKRKSKDRWLKLQACSVVIVKQISMMQSVIILMSLKYFKSYKGQVTIIANHDIDTDQIQNAIDESDTSILV